MKSLLNSIEELKCNGISQTIQQRMEEFHRKGQEPNEEIFKELCFCILTANYTAEGGIRIQQELGDGLLKLPEKKLAAKLKQLGHRFPNARAKYIVKARKHKNSLRNILLSFQSQQELRAWLVDEILGIGYKEASHFLRNIGYGDLAIIDFHIIALLTKHKLIAKPKSKSLSRKTYLEIEQILEYLAKHSNLTQGELDLYLWYLETGKVLK